MRYILSFLLPVFLFSLPSFAAEDTAQAPAGIIVEGSYALPTAPGQKNGAVFMTINNMTGKPVKLTYGASADIAEKVEFHTMSMENDVMKMRQVSGYDIPAQGSLKLEPQGNHIMLMGLKKPLVAGESFSVTLYTEQTDNVAAILAVPVNVTDMAAPPSHSHHAP